MNTQQGFSMIEMMIAMSLVAILSILAIPSMQQLINNSRSRSIASEFMSAVQFARSAAITRGNNVSICAASNTSHTSCGSASNWDNGWIVFNDPNSDGVLANNNDRLMVSEQLPSNTVINSSLAYLTFNDMGFLASSGGNFGMYVSGCTADNSRSIAILSSGQATVAKIACP